MRLRQIFAKIFETEAKYSLNLFKLLQKMLYFPENKESGDFQGNSEKMKLLELFLGNFIKIHEISHFAKMIKAILVQQ